MKTTENQQEFFCPRCKETHTRPSITHSYQLCPQCRELLIYVGKIPNGYLTDIKKCSTKADDVHKLLAAEIYKNQKLTYTLSQCDWQEVKKVNDLAIHLLQNICPEAQPFESTAMIITQINHWCAWAKAEITRLAKKVGCKYCGKKPRGALRISEFDRYAPFCSYQCQEKWDLVEQRRYLDKYVGG